MTEQRWKSLTDEDLHGLSSDERRAIRLAARGGWTGSPGVPSTVRVTEKTGLRIQSEASRGEPRAFYAFTEWEEAAFKELAARLDKLPRRRSQVSTPTPSNGVGHKWYHDGVSSEVHGRLCTTCRFREKRDGIASEPCSGSSKLYDAAFSEGRNAGAKAERLRIREVLGI